MKYCDKCVEFHGKCNANDGADCGKMLYAIIESQQQEIETITKDYELKLDSLATVFNQEQQHGYMLEEIIDEIKGIVGIPSMDGLRKHGLRENYLPDTVRYLHREWLEQTHRAGQESIKKDIKIDRLNLKIEQKDSALEQAREELEESRSLTPVYAGWIRAKESIAAIEKALGGGKENDNDMSS